MDLDSSSSKIICFTEVKGGMFGVKIAGFQ